MRRWPIQRLGSVVEVRVSPVDKKSFPHEEPILLCNYTHVYYNRHIDQRLPFMSGTASRKEVQGFRLRQGDVLITKDSESWTDIGVPAYVAEDMRDTLCGYHLAILRPKTGL